MCAKVAHTTREVKERKGTEREIGQLFGKMHHMLWSGFMADKT